MIGVPSANAYVVTSVLDKKKLASVLSFVWSAYYFSYIFAPAVGAYLATSIGMRWVLRLATLLSATATSVFFLLHSQHPQKNRSVVSEQSVSSVEVKRLWSKMLLWSAFFAMVTFSMGVARPYVPTFLNEKVKLSEFYVGLFGSINFAGMAFIGIAMGRLGTSGESQEP